MDLRDIVVFLDASPSSEERLRLATRIARDHGAYLSAVFVHHDKSAPGIDVRHGLMTGFMPDAPGARQRTASTDIIEQRLHDCLRWFGGDGNWYDVEDAGSQRLTAFARTADLVILGQISRDLRRGSPWRPDDIVKDCGRPVLMVPYIGTFTELGRRVLVAWDGSREAARALNDALPVIRTARAVTVMTVHTRDGDLQHHRESAQRVVRHLKRHDIPARTDHPLRCGSAVADVLLSAAVDISADLIVSGAYHHSPLREALIGGVSRGLLEHMTVPVLMSH